MAKRAPVKPTSISKITDDIWELLIQGKTYRYIAEHFGVKLSTLADFLAKPEHSARKRECLLISADIFADLAEEAFMQISDNAQNGEIMRQRELGQFYKWKSAKRNPKIYSERADGDESETKKYEPPQINVHISPEAIAKAKESQE